jgi:hypothetical protein
MADPLQEQVQQIEQQVNAAIQNPAVPKIYANGFHMGQTASDIFIVSLLAGRPACVQYMSFIAAKTLMKNLQHIIENIEAKTGQQILLMDEVQQRLTAVRETQ